MRVLGRGRFLICFAFVELLWGLRGFSFTTVTHRFFNIMIIPPFKNLRRINSKSLIVIKFYEKRATLLTKFIQPMQEEEEFALYRTRHIKRNILPGHLRPKTSTHRTIYKSKGYRSRNDDMPSYKSKADLVHLNNTVYTVDTNQFHPTNSRNFLQKCKKETIREEKMKRMATKSKLPLENSQQVEKFVQALIESNQFFRTIDRTLAESIAILSLRKYYEATEKLVLPSQQIGFILYGRIKLYNKDYKFVLNRGDTVGEHGLLGSTQKLNMKIMEPASILWLSFKSFSLLKQSLTTQGFRFEFNKLDTMLRMSIVKKKLHIR